MFRCDYFSGVGHIHIKHYKHVPNLLTGKSVLLKINISHNLLLKILRNYLNIIHFVQCILMFIINTILCYLLPNGRSLWYNMTDVIFECEVNYHQCDVLFLSVRLIAYNNLDILTSNRHTGFPQSNQRQVLIIHCINFKMALLYFSPLLLLGKRFRPLLNICK